MWQTPLDAWSTVATLVFVLLVTSIKEGYEDVQRAKSDSEDNNKKETVIVFDSNGLKREVPKKRKDVSDVSSGGMLRLTALPRCRFRRATSCI